MKKMKVRRFTGLPVEPEDIKEQRESWRALWDRMEARCEGDMFRLTRLSDRVQQIESKKYPTVGEWEYIRNKRAWAAAVEKYGPIMVAVDRETGDLAYFIYDALDQ